jgi:hypothetical protein
MKTMFFDSSPKYFNKWFTVLLLIEYDRKYINKKERERHLPGYCQYTSLEFVDYDETRWNIVAFNPHCDLHQLKRKSSSSDDEGRSTGWKLQYFIFFHRNPRTPTMYTDSSQVGVALFLSYQYIFYHFTFPGFPFI